MKRKTKKLLHIGLTALAITMIATSVFMYYGTEAGLFVTGSLLLLYSTIEDFYDL